VATGIFNITHSNSLGKYFGCPVFQKKPNIAMFRELIDKAMAKLAGWKAKCLSKAGRTVLIQSYLESLPAHTMQSFRLPYAISNIIDRVGREFFWKKNNTEKGLPLVAWDKVCRPKEYGGLGLRKTAEVNQAFQSKLAWNLLTNQDSMWVRIMRKKYLAHQDFFNAQIKQGDSMAWRSIIKSKELIRQGIIWTVGDGRDILFWQDNWIENRSLLELLSIEDHDTVDLGLKVSEFI